jgi:hypothetical protein
VACTSAQAASSQACSQVLMVPRSGSIPGRVPGQALIISAQRSTIQKYGSGHHTSGVWYTQPHYLSEITAVISDR